MSQKLAELLITVSANATEFYRAADCMDVAIARTAAHYYRNKYFRKWTE